jgi:hypothetical protein
LLGLWCQPEVQFLATQGGSFQGGSGDVMAA